MSLPYVAKTDPSLLIQEIEEGALDFALNLMQNAINSRREMIRSSEARRNAMSIKVGDRVVLKGLRPKYLNGLSAEVVTVGTKMNVRLDRPVGKYGRNITEVPANCVTLVRSALPNIEDVTPVMLVDPDTLDGPFLVEEESNE